MEHTAAQINACDIIVSISAAAAHLAGAMSKQTLLLLPKDHLVHWDFDCAYPDIERVKNGLTEVAKKILVLNAKPVHNA